MQAPFTFKMTTLMILVAFMATLLHGAACNYRSPWTSVSEKGVLPMVRLETCKGKSYTKPVAVLKFLGLYVKSNKPVKNTLVSFKDLTLDRDTGRFSGKVKLYGLTEINVVIQISNPVSKSIRRNGVTIELNSFPAWSVELSGWQWLKDADETEFGVAFSLETMTWSYRSDKNGKKSLVIKAPVSGFLPPCLCSVWDVSKDKIDAEIKNAFDSKECTRTEEEEKKYKAMISGSNLSKAKLPKGHINLPERRSFPWNLETGVCKRDDDLKGADSVRTKLNFGVDVFDKVKVGEKFVGRKVTAVPQKSREIGGQAVKEGVSDGFLEVFKIGVKDIANVDVGASTKILFEGALSFNGRNALHAKNREACPGSIHLAGKFNILASNKRVTALGIPINAQSVVALSVVMLLTVVINVFAICYCCMKRVQKKKDFAFQNID